jgi:hypothetical protein
VPSGCFHRGTYYSLLGSIDPSAIDFASIVGVPGLQPDIVIFDEENGRVGFAPHAACN